MKVHVALNTPRFDESVRFYRTFLGLDPVKHKPGYAKFDVAEPGLNLTLNASADVGAGALNHLGIQVASTAAVRAAAQRLKAEGLATFEEGDVDCCYALQDKVWVTDPNGYRWEVFVVKVGDTAPEVRAAMEAKADAEGCCPSGCCAE
ncbi:MAG TPA: ArsI/CadI family heavy metal resistance metalloenzyme [Gemmatimonadales bacterium]|nr:ArsI/CadI family heavy metal resistance metalloenzyme [Gemmatimonadales bacterium]